MNKLGTLLAASWMIAASQSTAFGQCTDQTLKLFANDGAGYQRFGMSSAISGTTGIVGAWDDDDNGVESGSAYLFDVTTGAQVFKLLASDGAAEDAFGYSVGIDGTTAIVGAPYDDDLGNNSGAAYLFDTATGQQSFKLLPSDGSNFWFLGGSVAISGTTAIVGAAGDATSGVNTGSAFLFDVTTGQQTFKLVPSDGRNGGRFGVSVAIHGTTAIVGAESEEGAAFHSGSAYLFDITTGQQIHRLVPTDGNNQSRFGYSVSISGTTAIVGETGYGDFGFRTGSAHLFDTVTGQESFQILPDDGADGDLFGYSVGISGTKALVGAPGNDKVGNFAGAAYLIDITTGQQTDTLFAADAAAADAFGGSTAISGTTAIVGAYGSDGLVHDAGAVFVFSIDSRGSHYCTASANSTGLAAGILSCGSASIAANDFTLSAEPVPNEPFLFFHGTNQVQMPFGNGFLCANGFITRMGPPGIATNNLARRTIDLPSSGIATAGTYHFQCWFRDPFGGGAAFNLSNGLSVDFTP